MEEMARWGASKGETEVPRSVSEVQDLPDGELQSGCLSMRNILPGCRSHFWMGVEGNFGVGSLFKQRLSTS